MEMVDRYHGVSVDMRPVCECGYVFEELTYNRDEGTFKPKCCPKCAGWIEQFSYTDLSKRSYDENGNISLCPY